MTSHLAAERFLAARIDFERTLSMPNSEEALKLDRMRELLRRLGNPQDAMAIIHVAGTKGKGSTAAMIAAMLSAAGFRTGLFTSPHLDSVEERLIVDARPCPPVEFAELVDSIRPEIEAMDRAATGRRPPEFGPTYFEIVTALALRHFARRRVNAAVLEVGLGGRLDSTNVCSPCLSVITSISLDHTRQLGETLESIAAEKAGIVKPGTPLVSGVRDGPAGAVIRRAAAANGCRLIELGVDFDFEYRPPRHLESAPSPATFDIKPRPAVAPDCWHGRDSRVGQAKRSPTNSGNNRGGTALRLSHPTTDFAPEHSAAEHSAAEHSAPGEYAGGQVANYSNVLLALLGRHQAANAAVALAAVEQLRRDGWTIPESAVRCGLAEVVWPARIEVVSRRPTVILDAAHNVASIEALVETLEESFFAPRRLLVFAATREKDVAGMLRILLGHFDHVILTRYANNPRGVPPEELQTLAATIKPRPAVAPDCWGGSSTAAPTVGWSGATDGRGFVIEIAPTSADAWAAVHRLARPDDLICVTGSFFLAAEMRRLIAARPL